MNNVLQRRAMDKTCKEETRRCINPKCGKVKLLNKANFIFLTNGYYSHTCRVCSNKRTYKRYLKHKPVTRSTLAFGD